MHKSFDQLYNLVMVSYNYYEILEINPSSAQHEITIAYEKARTTYSGENPAIYTMFSSDEAKELLKLVEEAYSVLGNKTLRALYDEKMSRIADSPGLGNISFEELKVESMTPKTLVPKAATSKPIFQVSQDVESFIKSHEQWTGKDIKRIREYKKYSLQQLSEVTKITAFYLNAIEEMTFENLPAPVFVRGYVIQISRVLGLNEKKVANAYMKAFKK